MQTEVKSCKRYTEHRLQGKGGRRPVPKGKGAEAPSLPMTTSTTALPPKLEWTHLTQVLPPLEGCRATDVGAVYTRDVPQMMFAPTAGDVVHKWRQKP